MSILNFIEPKVFFISLFVGFFLVYIFTPTAKVVFQYPTIYNTGKITYEDDTGQCYKYRHVSIPCPKNKKEIKSHIIQQI